jgi:putative aldouronate transport system substrate-binding protein
MFIDMPWYWSDKFEGIIPQEITKRTGVTLDMTRAADDKQLGLMIASGSLPDLIYADDESGCMSRLADSKFSYDYDTLMAKYAPDWKPGEQLLQVSRAVSADGKLYCVKSAFATAEEWKKQSAALHS